MTISHHPSDPLLLDYSVGSLAEASDLAMATHLTLCPRCRTDAGRLDAVGGLLLAAAGDAGGSDRTLAALMSRIAQPERAPDSTPEFGTVPAAAAPLSGALPRPLCEAIGSDLDAVPWRRLGMGAYQHVIPTRGPATARLLRIPAGRPVPEHTHRGLELTLVLRGAFSDATGTYARGDLQEADDSLVHQPHAAPGEDCICLAVTDAPLRFKGWAARLVQPFLKI